MKKRPQIAISLDKNDLDKIDKIASKLSISRSALVRNLVKASLDDVNILNAMGVVDLVGLYRRHANGPDRTATARPRVRTEPAV